MVNLATRVMSPFPADARAARARAGFTLIELLVAVALALLMMTLFAQIFAMATGSLSTQKGIGENDQKERTLDTLIRGDLDKRTFRKVYPFVRQGGTSSVEFTLSPYGGGDLADRRGYLHISEGFTQDETDDVLQLTVDMAKVQRNKDASELGGRAVRLADGGGAIRNNPNQPVYDDGQIGTTASDKSSQSSLAEVVYFVRRGTLYRRVLLIRQPLRTNFDTQPKAGAGTSSDTDLMTGVYSTADILASELTTQPTTNGNFLNDFDFSAHHVPEAATISATADRVVFHSQTTGTAAEDVLDNHPSNTTPTLGVPNFRFGFNPYNGNPVSYAATGTMPGESASSTQPFARFFGRFTHAETSFGSGSGAVTAIDTSYAVFGYPGVLGRGPDNQWATADDSNPYRRAGSATFGFTLNSNNLLENVSDGTEFRGPRIGEDILLTNVLAFDIKVLDDDPQVNDFVDIGHATMVGGVLRGFYGHDQNVNPGFGPLSIPVPLTAAGSDGLDGQPGVTGVDDDANGTTDDASERGWPGSDDLINRCFDTWHSRMPLPSTVAPPYTPFVAPSGQPPFRAVRPYFDYGKDGQPGFSNTISATFTDENGYDNTNAYDQTDGLWPGSDDLAIDVGPDGQPGRAGTSITDPNGDDDGDGITDTHGATYPSTYYIVAQRGLPDPLSGQPDFKELGAPGSDDRKLGVRPLRAIQIRIRYRDPSSGQIRDVTIRQALLDNLPLL